MAARRLMKLSGYLTELIILYNGFSEEEVQTLSVMAGKVEKTSGRQLRMKSIDKIKDISCW